MGSSENKIRTVENATMRIQNMCVLYYSIKLVLHHPQRGIDN